MGQATLANLLGLVASFAIGLAAMRVATQRSARVVFGSGLLVLLITTLVALVRRGGRARWTGFALFGWAYALILVVPPLREAVALELPGCYTLASAFEELVDVLHPPLPPPVEPPGNSPSTSLVKLDASGWHFEDRGRIVDLNTEQGKPWAAYLDRRNASDARVDAADGARRIALTFLGLAFALVGGAAGHALSDRLTSGGPRRDEPSNSPV